MGNLLRGNKKGGASEAKLSKAIDRTQKKDKAENARTIKLLLLGAGESGKSTLFKQMRRLYGVAFDKKELMIYKPGIMRNIIETCKELAIQCRELDPKQFPRPELSEEAKEAAAQIEKLDDGNTLDAKVGGLLKTLWNDKAIQKTYEYSAAYQLIDSVHYFMASENLDRICAKDYVPNYQDCLRCRIRTTGVVEFKFDVEKNQFIIIDVGGQRSERKKWLHFFQGVTAVIFVAAMSEYDQVLFEDTETNRLDESVGLFKQIANHESFKDTSMILFLNKSDLLEDKMTKVKFSAWREDFTGDDNSFEDIVAYMKDTFASQVDQENAISQKLYSHVTCATDTDQVAAVFTAVKDILLQESLVTSGLIE